MSNQDVRIIVICPSKGLFTASESDVSWKDQIDLYQFHSGQAKMKAKGKAKSLSLRTEWLLYQCYSSCIFNV